MDVFLDSPFFDAKITKAFHAFDPLVVLNLFLQYFSEATSYQTEIRTIITSFGTDDRMTRTQRIRSLYETCHALKGRSAQLGLYRIAGILEIMSTRCISDFYDHYEEVDLKELLFNLDFSINEAKSAFQMHTRKA